jgi:hypothetical protein
LARSLEKTPSARQAEKAGFPNRQSQFHKRSQLFIRTHKKKLSVIAMRVNNPDRSPLRIKL